MACYLKILRNVLKFFSGFVTLKRTLAIFVNLVDEFQMFKANDKNCTKF